MVRNTPTIRNGVLVVAQPSGPGIARIAVGSDAWFAWLDQAPSFVFDDPIGRLSARKRPRGKSVYWYGIRRRQGKLYDHYLGKSAAVTLDRLREAAVALNPPPAGNSVPLAGRSSPSAKTASRQRPREAAPGSLPGVPLLPDKTRVPQVQPSSLVRTGVIAHLRQAIERRLTVVTAPAGYGKTTVLAQWIVSSHLPVAWVSLDAGDSDPARFWTYVSAALDQIVPGLLDAIQPLIRVSYPGSPEEILGVLIRGLAAAPDPTILVLDEHHTVRADGASLHDMVALLVEHLPPPVRCVFASREEPALPLARLRAQDQLLELRAADLQLTLEETTILLTQLFRLDLSAEQLTALHTRTEGWVAGLRLAALSLQKESDVASWIGAFSGENRSVFDYLVEEVVQRLPTEMQSYVLRVGLLDRLTASLCDAVTGTHNGPAMLAELERRELFLVALDDQRRWYRFHHLFASALRHLLRQTQPEIVPQVFARASAWSEASGHPREAIDYAFAANDLGRAAQLIEAYVPLALEKGDTALLRERLERLPEQALRERPRLCVAHAYTLVMSGERAMVPRRLREAEEAIASAAYTLTASDLAILQAELSALRINLQSTLSEGSPRAIITLCHQTLAGLPPHHPFRAFVSAHLGVAHLLDGDVEAARKLLSTLMRASEAKGDVLYFCASLLYSGVAMHVQGRLDDALGLCRRAKQQVDVADYVADDGDASLRAAIDLVMGRALYERNELEAAAGHLRSSDCVRFAQAASLGEGFPSLAYTYQAQGDTAAARDVIERALAKWEQSEAENHQLWVWTGSLIRAHQARLWLLQGDVGPASRWAHNLVRHADDERAKGKLPPTYVREWEQIVLARVYLAEGRASEALALSAALVAPAESSGRMARLLEILTLQAVAHDALGDTDAALRALARAVALAASERFVRTFIDGGPSVERLLSQLAATISAQGLMELTMVGATTQRTPVQRQQEAALLNSIKALVAAFGSTEQRVAGEAIAHLGTSAAGASQDIPLTASLTERELEVMRCVATGATNRAIADELVIAPSTVKHHVHSIFKKMDVSNRTQALARAHALHLLDLGGGPSPVC